MRAEIRTFTIVCDKCQTKETFFTANALVYPDGWGRGFYYCDEAYCTGHDQDLCPVHYKEYVERKEAVRAEVAEWKEKRAKERNISDGRRVL